MHQTICSNVNILLNRNPNIWSSLRKVSYGGLFISIKLFISERPHLMALFKGSQNNKKDVKSVFQQPFHGHQRCRIIRSVTLLVTCTRHFQETKIPWSTLYYTTVDWYTTDSWLIFCRHLKVTILTECRPPYWFYTVSDSTRVTNWLAEWLTYSLLTNQLTDLLMDRLLADWLTHWLTDWVADLLSDCLIYWLVNLLIGCLIDWPNGPLEDQRTRVIV